MKQGLRHSHIALAQSIENLADLVDAPLTAGVDDLDRYSFFDLQITHEDKSGQTIRFASHEGDSMVHLLAEDIESTSDLAAALFAVGIRDCRNLSISTDPGGNALRQAGEVQNIISSMVAMQSDHELVGMTSAPKDDVTTDRDTKVS